MYLVDKISIPDLNTEFKKYLKGILFNYKVGKSITTKTYESFDSFLVTRQSLMFTMTPWTSDNTDYNYLHLLLW